MSRFEETDFEKKFQLLLKRLRLLHVEKQKLQEKLGEKEAKIHQQKHHLTELEEKIKILRMTTLSGNNEENDSEFKREAQATINSYINEIDHCIASLNP